MTRLASAIPNAHGFYEWPWCCYCGNPMFATDGSMPMSVTQTMCRPCKSARRRAQSAAISAVRRAVDSGQLTAPYDCTCADCGREAEVYEHRDYAKPLDVVPVCKACNRRRGPAKWRQLLI